MNVRSQPNTQSSILTTLSYGTQILVTGQEEGQNIVSGGQSSTAVVRDRAAQQRGHTGYISSLYVEITGDLDMPDTPVISYEDGYVTMTANSEEETIYYTNRQHHPHRGQHPLHRAYLSGGDSPTGPCPFWTGRRAARPWPRCSPMGPSSHDFTSEDWFFEDVDRAVGYGIFGGSGNGSFEPTENISRGDFVKALANMDGVDLSGYTGETAFQDVDPDSLLRQGHPVGHLHGVHQRGERHRL